MKAFLTLLLLSLSFHSFATHWLTYYVYAEKEYLQGPWIRAEKLGPSQYKYLAAEPFEDLLGTEDIQLAELLLLRLSEKNPDNYRFPYQLRVQNDTVIFQSEGNITNPETVKNEVTATLLFNGFKAVTFQLPDAQQTLTLNDLTVPYFDIVTTTAIPIAKADTPAVTAKAAPKELQPPGNDNSRQNNWLLLSVLINVLLAGLLLWRLAVGRRKS